MSILDKVRPWSSWSEAVGREVMCREGVAFPDWCCLIVPNFLKLGLQAVHLTVGEIVQSLRQVLCSDHSGE